MLDTGHPRDVLDVVRDHGEWGEWHLQRLEHLPHDGTLSLGVLGLLEALVGFGDGRHHDRRRRGRDEACHEGDHHHTAVGWHQPEDLVRDVARHVAQRPRR